MDKSLADGGRRPDLLSLQARTIPTSRSGAFDEGELGPVELGGAAHEGHR